MQGLSPEEILCQQTTIRFPTKVSTSSYISVHLSQTGRSDSLSSLPLPSFFRDIQLAFYVHSISSRYLIKQTNVLNRNRTYGTKRTTEYTEKPTEYAEKPTELLTTVTAEQQKHQLNTLTHETNRKRKYHSNRESHEQLQERNE